MKNGMSPELAATLLNSDPATIRRVAKNIPGAYESV